MAKKKGLVLREVVLFGVLGALTFAAKVAMSFLPNIEPVSLFVMLFAVVFGRKCVYPIYVYVAMELIVYPMDLWSIAYLYVWAVLALGAWLLKKAEGPLPFAVLSCAFGMVFGWWINGIPYDISHAIGNFAIALAAFTPLRGLLERLYRNIRK